MIELQNVSKAFGDIQALRDLTLSVPTGGVFGLVGTNGAGKSTLLRILAGVYKQDAGTATLGGLPVFENPEAKANVFYVSDDAFYFRGATMQDMRRYYQRLYPDFDANVFASLCKSFSLDPERRLTTFSKGMARQAMLILGLASQTPCLLMDETFDGLDPVVRLAVKRLLADAVYERKLTAVISSHSLRELEDIAERVGLLHDGDLVMDLAVEHIQTGMRKVQCAFAEEARPEWFDGLKVLSFQTRSRLCTLVAEEEEETILRAVNAHDPQFTEMIPLTLEELFIAKMEGIGYEIKEILA